MNRSVFYGVVVTALVSLAALVPTAAADGVTVSRFPVSFGFFNPCTNENVDFSGTAMTVADQTPDTHGLTFHSIDVSLKGVGATSGDRYHEQFAITVSLQGTEDASDNGAFSENNVVHSRIVAQGPRNDLVFSIVFHQTINANGELVVFNNTVTTEACV